MNTSQEGVDTPGPSYLASTGEIEGSCTAGAVGSRSDLRRAMFFMMVFGADFAASLIPTLMPIGSAFDCIPGLITGTGLSAFGQPGATQRRPARDFCAVHRTVAPVSAAAGCAWRLLRLTGKQRCVQRLQHLHGSPDHEAAPSRSWPLSVTRPDANPALAHMPRLPRVFFCLHLERRTHL